MLDVWVCSSCHSLNRERATVCYKCGGPREQSTGEGEGLRPGRAIQTRLVSGYRSTIELAILAGFLILVVVGIEVYATILERSSVTAVSALLDRIAAGGAFDAMESDASFAEMDRLTLPSIGAFVAALLALATWLSVTVGNVPGLGGAVDLRRHRPEQADLDTRICHRSSRYPCETASVTISGRGTMMISFMNVLRPTLDRRFNPARCHAERTASAFAGRLRGRGRS